MKNTAKYPDNAPFQTLRCEQVQTIYSNSYPIKDPQVLLHL